MHSGQLARFATPETIRVDDMTRVDQRWSQSSMNIPMTDELREAVRKLRPKLGARSDAAAVRIAVARLCREHGIAVRGSEEHPDPDDQPDAPAPVAAAPSKEKPTAARTPMKKK
ncbi:hypothetical protein WMF28_01880 [Sorangium sp. So ce590]|uniref:hypothetical protein n=1 Tax=Sorangium sp. So ce590 TaxID=3133317 RepID=UPI003F6316FE